MFKKVDDTDGEHYIMDGSVNVGVFTESGSLKHWNILADGVSGRIKPDGDKVYYLKDHLGSTRMFIAENGVVQESHDYYPFGLEMPFRSFVSGSPKTKELFTGKERDAETGLDYFGARYYDASIGRWLSVDPWDYKYPSLSPYNYTSNNPINMVDQNGKGFTGLPIFAYFNAQIEYGATLKEPPNLKKSSALAASTFVLNPSSRIPIIGAVIGSVALVKLGTDLLQNLGHMMAESTEEDAPSSGETAAESDEGKTETTLGPKGGKKHQPGRGHDKKSQPQKRKRFQKKQAQKIQQQQQQQQQQQKEWDSLSDDAKKIYGSIEQFIKSQK